MRFRRDFGAILTLSAGHPENALNFNICSPCAALSRPRFGAGAAPNSRKNRTFTVRESNQALKIMSKVLFGSFVVDMRGKVGGTVYSRAKGIATARNKVTPVNRRTAGQQLARSVFGNQSAGWRQLSQAQRDTWIAGAPNFVFKDVFGGNKTLSGQQLFVSINSNLLKIQRPSITDCPTPQGANVVLDGPGLLLTYSATPTPSLTLDASNVSSNAPITLYLRATPPMSQGISNPAGRFSSMQTAQDVPSIAPIAASTPITALYSSKFGVLPPSGSVIWLEATPINEDTGEAGAPIIFPTYF